MGFTTRIFRACCQYHGYAESFAVYNDRILILPPDNKLKHNETARTLLQGRQRTAG